MVSEVFIGPTEELGLSADKVLRVMDPLHRITQSGIQYYLTYLDHNLNLIGMLRTVVDP